MRHKKKKLKKEKKEPVIYKMKCNMTDIEYTKVNYYTIKGTKENDFDRFLSMFNEHIKHWYYLARNKNFLVDIEDVFQTAYIAYCDHFQHLEVLADHYTEKKLRNKFNNAVYLLVRKENILCRDQTSKREREKYIIMMNSLHIKADEKIHNDFTEEILNKMSLEELNIINKDYIFLIDYLETFDTKNRYELKETYKINTYKELTEKFNLLIEKYKV